MPNSLYLDPEDMVKFYDVRRLQEILSDDGTAVDSGDIGGHPTLLTGIEWATGEINTAIYQGKRYTPENIQDLIDNAVGSSGNTGYVSAVRVLQQLMADLVFGWLMGRRGYGPDVMDRLAPRYKSAQETLERLYLGERVFNVAEAIEAGVPKVQRIGGGAFLPSAEFPILGVWWDTGYPGRGGPSPRDRMW